MSSFSSTVHLHTKYPHNSTKKFLLDYNWVLELVYFVSDRCRTTFCYKDELTYLSYKTNAVWGHICNKLKEDKVYEKNYKENY